MSELNILCPICKNGIANWNSYFQKYKCSSCEEYFEITRERDADRLYKFYEQLCTYHKTYFPDWRFSQLIANFERWMSYTKKINDIFYIEEDAFLRHMAEFVYDMGIK